MVKTTRKECECGVRILIVRGCPPLDFGQDPAGNVAVTITSPRTARWLKAGEAITRLEHRHSVHTCEHIRHAAQRDQARAAQSAHAAAQRRGRTRPAAPGVLPGVRVYPGGRP